MSLWRVERLILLHANKVLESKFTKWPRDNGSRSIFKNRKTTKFLEYFCPYGGAVMYRCDQLVHTDSAKYVMSLHLDLSPSHFCSAEYIKIQSSLESLIALKRHSYTQQDEYSLSKKSFS